MEHLKTNKNGFTIVELLVVVVVIAILATITVIAYNGIQNRAKDSSVRNELGQLSKKIESSKIISSSERYPATLSDAGINVLSFPGVQYSVASQGKAYCLNAQDGTIKYHVTQSASSPRTGSCGTVQGLIGWWPMNGDAQDYSGNNLNGTVVGATLAAGANNQPNTAYSFNGTASQILCGTSALLRPTAEVSVTAWIKPNAFGSGQVGILSNGTGGYRMTLANTGIPNLAINNAAMPTGSITSIALNTWYFVNVRYKNGQGTVEMYGYPSEDYGASSTVFSQGSITNYGTAECQIGSINNTPGQYFNGLIDDVRVFDRVLTGSETDDLYYAGAY